MSKNLLIKTLGILFLLVVGWFVLGLGSTLNKDRQALEAKKVIDRNEGGTTLTVPTT